MIVDTKTDTWTKSSLYYDEPIDTCDRSFLISGINRLPSFSKDRKKKLVRNQEI